MGLADQADKIMREVKESDKVNFSRICDEIP